jgi:hypothetical protein
VHNNTAPNLATAKFTNYSKYANAQFVSWYGYTAANTSSCYYSGSYFSCYRDKGDNALAFTSPVTAATKKVTVPLFSFYPSAQYAVNIYTSSGGLPGSVIATSKTFSDSDTGLCCTASRTVAIKANLTAGTQYFLGVVGASNPSYGGWDMENTDFSGASVDYYHFTDSGTYSYGTGSHTFNYSSPWHASTYYPTTGAAVLK